MAKSDPLFLLIKALTKAERRQFRIDAAKFQTSESKDYLRLFDAIDAQKEYDEKAIRKKFLGEPYFKHLGSLKMYLHGQIMRSLKNLYDDTSGSVKLSNYLLEIEILFKKRLYKNCANTIKKAKAYAKKYDSAPHLIKILEMEIALADYTYDFNHGNLAKETATKEAIENADRYSEYAKLRQIYFESRRQGHIMGQAWLSGERFDDSILQHPLVSGKMPSFKGELTRLAIKMHHAQWNRSTEEILAGFKDIMKLYDAHPHQIDEFINAYFSSLLELTIFLIAEKKFGEAQQYLQKVRNIYSKKQSELMLFSKIKVLIVEAGFLLEKGDFAQALDFIAPINKLIDASAEEADYMGSTIRLYTEYLCFYIYFRNKDYRSAQINIQKIINANNDTQLYIQSAMRIANLILQYEQKEYKHMGYVLRSTYRYLMKIQRLNEPETIILNFIKKAISFTSEREVLPALAEFKEQILPYVDEPFLSDFGLLEWIESKLEKREFAEVVKEKYLIAVTKEKAEA